MPVQRYVERVGPGFAARASDRLEAMRLDRPADPPVPLPIDLPGLTGQPAFGVDGKHLYVTQFLNDTNGDGEIDGSDHRGPVPRALRFRRVMTRRRAPPPPGRAAHRLLVELPVPVAVGDACSSPPCTRQGGSGLDIFSLPADGQVLERLERRAAGASRCS